MVTSVATTAVLLFIYSHVKKLICCVLWPKISTLVCMFGHCSHCEEFWVKRGFLLETLPNKPYWCCLCFLVLLCIAQIDLGVDLLGRPLLGRLWLCVNTHLNSSDKLPKQITQTSAFIEVLTLVNDQLAVCRPVKTFFFTCLQCGIPDCRVHWTIDFKQLHLKNLIRWLN